MSKVCVVCKEEKPLDQFPKKSVKDDTYQNRCKKCHNSINAKLKLKYKNEERNYECYKIWPLNHNTNEWQVGKHTGSVSKHKYNSGTLYFRADTSRIDGTKTSKSFSYNTENEKEIYLEAEKWIRNYCTENGTLKNRIRVIDENTIEVELDKGQTMKTDIKFCDICQQYRIMALRRPQKDKFYACFYYGPRSIFFHKYITGFKIVDHINRDSLDNCLANLREVTYKINNNNVSMHSNNTTGYTGVQFDGKNWVARLERDLKNHSKAFSIKKYGEEEAKRLAIEHRIALCKQFGNNNQLSKDIPNFIEQ